MNLLSTCLALMSYTSPLLKRMAHNIAVVSKNQYLVYGGVCQPDRKAQTCSDDLLGPVDPCIWLYDNTSHPATWYNMGTPPSTKGLKFAKMLFDDKHIYIHGGGTKLHTSKFNLNASNLLLRGEIQRIPDGKKGVWRVVWEEVSGGPRVYYQSLTVHNNTLFIIGGIGHGSTMEVHSLNLESKGWVLTNTTLPAMYGHTATYANGMIIIIGGTANATDISKYSEYVHHLDPVTLELTSYKAPIKVHNHAAVQMGGDSVHISGGFAPDGGVSGVHMSGTKKSTYMYNASSGAWTMLEGMCSPRECHSTLYNHEGCVVTYSGGYHVGEFMQVL